MYVFVQDPNGVGTTLELDSAADIQIRPGFVYTFLDLDLADAEFRVGRVHGQNLVIDVPGLVLPIKLLDFVGIQASEQPARLQLQQGADTLQLHADSPADFLTGSYTFRPALEGVRVDRTAGDSFGRSNGGTRPLAGHGFGEDRTVGNSNTNDRADVGPYDSLGGRLLSPTQAAAVIESFGMLPSTRGAEIQGPNTPTEPAGFIYPDGNDAGATDASPATITVTAVNDAPTTNAVSTSGAEIRLHVLCRHQPGVMAERLKLSPQARR